MARLSLPVEPADGQLGPYGRLLVGGIVVTGVALAVVALVDTVGSTPVVLDATVIETPPSDATVREVDEFPAESPVRTVIERARADSSASVDTTRKRLRDADVTGTRLYVVSGERVVRVNVRLRE